MILRGLSQYELELALERCQESYDNNLMFNRFDIKNHVVDVSDIHAIEMSGAVIIGHSEKESFTVNVSKRVPDERESEERYYPFFKTYPNPFINNQWYYVFGDSKDGYGVYIYYRDDCDFIDFDYTRNCKDEKHVVDVLKNNLNAKRIDFTLRVKDSKGEGGHRSHSGRRTVSACWHVHRDVMKEIFDINPSATLKTSLAYYKGKDDFYEKFEETGLKNIGSDWYPAYASEGCDC